MDDADNYPTLIDDDDIDDFETIRNGLGAAAVSPAIHDFVFNPRQATCFYTSAGIQLLCNCCPWYAGDLDDPLPGLRVEQEDGREPQLKKPHVMV